MAISNEQLAELIIGFAKSQNAIIEAFVQQMPNNEGLGLRGQILIPILRNNENIGNNVPPTLSDLPSRILLQLQGSQQDVSKIQEWLTKELNRITDESHLNTKLADLPPFINFSEA